ncbi:MAG TPA: NADH-quinone oxidoreductase subunit D [Thermodesulfobacteriota bacterium]|nr:NADH-quinone oxidoreductase subunit D [Thermodesulfobacteriota bacterium]
MEERVIEREFGELALNMGPQHPSTHGVFRMELHLKGETVVKVVPHIGYLHRGVEKLSETLDYDMLPPIYERDDYLSPTSNSLAFVLAVEKLAGIDVPRRASYLRVLVAELQRVASHLVWLGTFGLDLGGALGGGSTLFLYCFRERERILDLMEALTGTRFHTNMNQVGGVRYDVYPGFDRDVSKTVDYLRERIGEYRDMLENNPVFLERTRGVGVVPSRLAKEVGASGPVIRGSGVAYDVRKSRPYSGYNEFEFKIPVGESGDAYDRYRVRLEEMFQSLSIVTQAIEGLPDGAIHSRKPVKSALLLKPPKGDAYASVESPRGELGVFIVSDGSSKPYRVKVRSPSFSNIALIPHIMPGHLVADTVAILGSLDPVFGDVDR